MCTEEARGTKYPCAKISMRQFVQASKDSKSKSSMTENGRFTGCPQWDDFSKLKMSKPFSRTRVASSV